jgi:cyclase
MDADGTRAGYDIGMITAVRAIAKVPLIASGGAGALEDFAAALDAGADALLAASVFHFGIHRIGDVKRYLSAQGYTIRNNATA